VIAALQVGSYANGIDCTDSYRHVKRQNNGGIQPSAPSAAYGLSVAGADLRHPLPRKTRVDYSNHQDVVKGLASAKRRTSECLSSNVAAYAFTNTAGDCTGQSVTAAEATDNPHACCQFLHLSTSGNFAKKRGPKPPNHLQGESTHGHRNAAKASCTQ
jgi:hypothetical protein